MFQGWQFSFFCLRFHIYKALNFICPMFGHTKLIKMHSLFKHKVAVFYTELLNRNPNTLTFDVCLCTDNIILFRFHLAIKILKRNEKFEKMKNYKKHLKTGRLLLRDQPPTKQWIQRLYIFQQRKRALSSCFHEPDTFQSLLSIFTK